MKKKKISAGLVSSFIAALALTACSGVSANDSAIVTYTGYDGEKVNVLTNTVYNKYRQSSDGIAKFYSAILESIIRYEFDSSSTAVWKKDNAQIKTEAENNVTGAKQKAEENAKTNNTDYSTEWDSILSSYGVDDEEGLLQHFIYQIEKEELEEKYFNDNKLALTKEYLGIDDAGQPVESKAKSALPYHIRHVLVSVSDGADNYFSGTISSEQAKNIGNVMDYLMDSKYSFAEIAKKLSSDEGSAAKGGDVGIMTPSTSFVNEFKLGVYYYDNVFGGRTENATIQEGLGLKEEITLGMYGKENPGETKIGKTTIKDEVSRLGLAKVPYDAFVQIGKEAETELVNGKKVNDGNANYYPRNVYWNNFLNLHNPFVITDQILNADGEPITDTTIDADAPRWSAVQADGNRYLTDEAGHIIIGVRGSYGIHLMIMQKSIYDFNDGSTLTPSLEEYYTTYVPGDQGYPTFEGKNKSTYVNYITTDDVSEYNTRATEIKSAIKSFDSTYDYRLYELLTSGEGGRSKITFNNTDGLDLGEAINKYIAATRANNKNSATDSLTSSWKTYLELLNVQNQQRDYTIGTTTGPAGSTVPAGTEIKRVVSVRCAIGFTTGTTRTGDWAEGGLCYYEE